MASKIVSLIPKHTVYVEPFCGGATVMFAKPWPNVTNTHHYREVINDQDESLINMYRVFQTRFDEIEHLLMNTLYSESECRKANAIVRGHVDADDLGRAWAYYVSIQQSFSNNLAAGWRRNLYGGNSSATWSSKLSALNEYRERVSAVYISCDDGLKVIKQWDSPQTFFYCDPPYPGAYQGHYSGYTSADFSDLVATLDQCHGSFLLSNYDQAGIPADWERFEFRAVSSASKTTNTDRSRKATSEEMPGQGSRTEVVWRRLNRTPVREEIQRLYDSGKFDCFA